MSERRPAAIAVVEDNPADIFLLQYALREHDVPYAFTVLSNGQEAMEYLDRIEKEAGEKPDLLIVDLNLPVYSGLELLARIRSSPELQTIKVAILTTSEAATDEVEADALGAQLYLRKPTNLDDFVRLGGPLRRTIYGDDSSQIDSHER